MLVMSYTKNYLRGLWNCDRFIWWNYGENKGGYAGVDDGEVFGCFAW